MYGTMVVPIPNNSMYHICSMILCTNYLLSARLSWDGVGGKTIFLTITLLGICHFGWSDFGCCICLFLCLVLATLSICNPRRCFCCCCCFSRCRCCCCNCNAFTSSSVATLIRTEFLINMMSRLVSHSVSVSVGNIVGNDVRNESALSIPLWLVE